VFGPLAIVRIVDTGTDQQINNFKRKKS